MRKFLILVSFLYSLLSFGQAQPPDNLTGQELRSWLKTNWYNGNFSSRGYNGARSAMYSKIDVDSDGRVYCVYTGFNQNAANTTYLNPINAEHTIPQSWFNSDEPMKSDIFHLYPTHGNVNSARSNKPFDEIPDNETNTWYTGNSNGITSSSSIPNTNIQNYSENDSDRFEPREDHKGDLARAAFYFFTMYDISSYNGKTLNSFIIDGDVAILYDWHIQDPVDDWELQRNNRIEEVQGNRNPYVDYPELACKAWGFQCDTSPTPVLNIQSSLQAFPATDQGAFSSSQSYQIAGQDFQGSLSLSVSANFQISLDNQTFHSELTIIPTDGSLTETIFVRFAPAEGTGGVLTGSIEHVSPNLARQTISVNGQVTSEPDPKLTITGNLSDFGEVSFGGTTTSQNYQITGSGFVDDLDIIASKNFEVSQDNQNFDSMLQITPVSGALSATIYVRFAPSENANSAVGGTISHESDWLDKVEISISGIEENDPNPPVLTISEAITDFGGINFGQPSMSQSYTVTGTDFRVDLNIASTPHFELSLDDTNFSDELSLSPTTGAIAETTIYVRFNPTENLNEVINGTIKHAAEGLENVIINVSGNEIPDPELNIIAAIPTFAITPVNQVSFPSPYTIDAENLTQNISIAVSSHFEISLDGDSYLSTIVLSPENGIIDNAEVFVRFAPKINANDTIRGSITHVSELADVVINLVGIEQNDVEAPGIQLDETLNDFGVVQPGESSASQSYIVSGGELTSNITISGSEGFFLSKDNTNFTSSITLVRSGNVVPQTIINARFIPTATKNGTYDGVITHTATGYADVQIRVTGTKFEETLEIPKIQFSEILDDFDQIAPRLCYVVADMKPKEAIMVRLVLTSTTNISYGTNGFVTTPPVINGLLDIEMPALQDTVSISLEFPSDLSAKDNFQINFDLLSSIRYDLGDNVEMTLKYQKPEAPTPLAGISKRSLNFYPNPTSGILFLSENPKVDRLEMRDVAGRKIAIIYSEKLNKLILPQLTDGLYFLKYAIGKENFSQKIIIKNE